MDSQAGGEQRRGKSGENQRAGVSSERGVSPVPVYVQCKGFRCLAYRDEQGVWRYASDGKELPEVLKVLSEGSR
jgi:hypothetical protein